MIAEFGQEGETSMEDKASDVQNVQALILRQFSSMTWSTGRGPDLHSFNDDFVAGASLYPSIRPLSVQSIAEFGERMSELAQTSLRSFHERVIGTKVHVFGNVAVAVVACENTENESNVQRNVEMILLVKDGRRWKIAAQAWDRQTADRQIPSDFLSGV
jgi:hypothetical protein